MQRKFMLLLTSLASLLVTMLVLAATDQTPTLDPKVIGGGGGHIEQGNLTLDNTLGQSVVGVDTASTLELCTGFWCAASTETVPDCVPVTDFALAVSSAGTIYTATVVEFTANLMPDKSSAPYTYTINGGMPQTGTVKPLVFTQTWTTTGVQTVTLAVWNCATTQVSAATKQVTVTVYPPGSSVALDKVTVQGQITGTPGIYTFTTTYTPYDASIPITYTWDNGATTASITRALSLGVETLIVTATNPVNTVTDTHTITVTCAQINDVDLTITSAGTIYTDTVVEFTANLMPDKSGTPYTYTINSGAPQTGTAKPLVFTQTFPITGSHTVEVALWNCSMTQTDAITDRISLTVYPQEALVGLNSVTIQGKTSGPPGQYTFTTDYAPSDASEPITYTWDNGDMTTSSTRFLGEGITTLVVTATNPVTVVTDTHIITITSVCTSVTSVDLFITSAEDEIYTDTVVEFTAHIAPHDTSTPYTYTLNGGAPQTNTIIPLVFTRTFPTTGTKTVELAFWNCTMTQTDAVTDSLTIEINAAPTCQPVTGVDLAVVSAGTIYTDTVVQFAAHPLPNNANVPYNYRINSGLEQTSMATSIAFTQTFPTTGTYTVEVTLWNCEMTPADAVTKALEITVYKSGQCLGLDSVTIDGPTDSIPGDYVFAAEYTPFDASLPITYTWDNKDTTKSSSRTMTPGTHTLSITATNRCSTDLLTDTHTIIISGTPVCIPVAGVTLTKVTAGDIDTRTLFKAQADIAPDDATEPYTYTVDYGMGPSTPMTETHAPLPLSHTFDITGTHTITCAVWNCTMRVTEAHTNTLTIWVNPGQPGGGPGIYLPFVLRY